MCLIYICVFSAIIIEGFRFSFLLAAFDILTTYPFLLLIFCLLTHWGFCLIVLSNLCVCASWLKVLDFLFYWLYLTSYFYFFLLFFLLLVFSWQIHSGFHLIVLTDCECVCFCVCVTFLKFDYFMPFCIGLLMLILSLL